jgi:hypothetical protein
MKMRRKYNVMTLVASAALRRAGGRREKLMQEGNVLRLIYIFKRPAARRKPAISKAQR